VNTEIARLNQPQGSVNWSPRHRVQVGRIPFGIVVLDSAWVSGRLYDSQPESVPCESFTT
jgi:hypothetical protein